MTEVRDPSCPRGLSIFLRIIDEMGNQITHHIADAGTRGGRGCDRRRRRWPLRDRRRGRSALAMGVLGEGVLGSDRVALVLPSDVGLR